MSAAGDGGLSPAEERVREHLSLLQVDAPTGRELVPAVIVARARWQRAVLAPLRSAGHVLGSVIDGAKLLLRMASGRGGAS